MKKKRFAKQDERRTYKECSASLVTYIIH